MFGYTVLDPIMVCIGIALTIYLGVRRQLSLLSWLPLFLTVYFVVPIYGFITLWVLVPPIVTLIVLSGNSIPVPESSIPYISFFLLILVASCIYAMTLHDVSLRFLVRAVYYVGLLGLFLFAFKLGWEEDGLDSLIKGIAYTSIFYSIYGAYQVVADASGLPYRGILRGIDAAAASYEMGFLRVNSLANEPKRLGYILFSGAIAIMFIRKKPTTLKLKAAIASFVVIMSLLTFSGSYYISIAVFLALIPILFFKKYALKSAIMVMAVSISALVFSGGDIIEAIKFGYERRINEVDIGLDGDRVYRQEFFAEDYLLNNPEKILSGVGMGQYYYVLNREYGSGVGVRDDGRLMPMNSTILEILMDLGISGVVLIYGFVLVQIYKSYVAGENFLFLTITFLFIQSFTISTSIFMAPIMGVAAARCLNLRGKKPNI